MGQPHDKPSTPANFPAQKHEFLDGFLASLQPDVISVNPSLGAWAPATAVSRSAHACFFLHVIGLPPYTIEVGFPLVPVETISRRIAFSRLQPFRYVQALRFARLPDRSYRCDLSPQSSRGFYVRAEHASLPPHASDMLTTRPGNWWYGDLHPTRFTALSAAPVLWRVESRTGAVTVVSRWILDGAFASPPQSGLAWFCFLSPLIEPDSQIRPSTP